MKQETICQRDSMDNDGRNDIRYIDFFCGVGGWSHAMRQACAALEEAASIRRGILCCAALDHSDLCLNVYHHNFQLASCSGAKRAAALSAANTVRIQDLTTKHLIDWNADIWLMSPPCQPHTRQHSNQEQDLEDPRSQSFLHLCSLLEELPIENLPAAIVLENVDGFQHSRSAQRFFSVLSRVGKQNQNCQEGGVYRVGNFLLQPHQVLLPNDRPRFFCVAVQQSRIVAGNIEDDPLRQYLSDTPTRTGQELVIHRSLKELNVAELHEEEGEHNLANECFAPQRSRNAPPPASTITSNPAPISDFLSDTNNDEELAQQLRIPEKVLERSAAWCYDIVTPQSRRSACFTSSYGKFIRGTGSVLLTGGRGNDATPMTTTSTTTATMKVPASLALQRPEDRSFDANWADGLDLKSLRYFSGKEMARLLGFDETFCFPPGTTMKQQWKLMGNSLNVRIAARLCELVLRVAFTSPP